MQKVEVDLVIREGIVYGVLFSNLSAEKMDAVRSSYEILD